MGNDTFGELLKNNREEVGLTQRGLAERAGIGLQTLRNYEQGIREPTFVNALKLAKALGVDVSKLAPQDAHEAPPTSPKKSPRAGQPKRSHRGASE